MSGAPPNWPILVNQAGRGEYQPWAACKDCICMLAGNCGKGYNKHHGYLASSKWCINWSIIIGFQRAADPALRPAALQVKLCRANGSGLWTPKKIACFGLSNLAILRPQIELFVVWRPLKFLHHCKIMSSLTTATVGIYHASLSRPSHFVWQSLRSTTENRHRLWLDSRQNRFIYGRRITDLIFH